MTPSRPDAIDKEAAVASGSALIHYAVHFREPGEFPLDELFFALTDVAEMFASKDVSRQTAEAWRRDPWSRLDRFVRELVALETASPSRRGDTAKRLLTDRETAIIVGRFLTAPGVSREGPGFRTMAARRQWALELPDRPSSGYRRFELSRPGASDDQYWAQFLSELRAHIACTQQGDQNALDLLPASTRAILNHAERYADDLGAQLKGTIPGAADAADIYIERDIEKVLLADIRDGDATVLGLSGEAGTGKSSVLWSLRGKLRDAGMCPLLLSATWMASDGADRLLRVSDVVEHALQIRNAGMMPVVLLDTADLLLHTEGLEGWANGGHKEDG